MSELFLPFGVFTGCLFTVYALGYGVGHAWAAFRMVAEA